MENKRKEAYKDRQYDIVPYNPEWADKYKEYEANIKGIFGDDIEVEHIGSTSVPGMSGKPTIDVLVIVPDMSLVDERKSAMEAAGFHDDGEFVMPGSKLFRRMQGNTLFANIHFYPAEHDRHEEMLAIRDYLREHPEEVAEYSKLKKDLYKNYAHDYGSYRKHKDTYMNDLIKRVKE